MSNESCIEVPSAGGRHGQHRSHVVITAKPQVVYQGCRTSVGCMPRPLALWATCGGLIVGCGAPKLPGPFLKRVPRRYSGMVPSTSSIQFSNSLGCEENAAAQSLDWNGDEGGACRAESPCTKVSQHQLRHSGEHLKGQRTTWDTFSIVRLSTRNILRGSLTEGTRLSRGYACHRRKCIRKKFCQHAPAS